MTASDFSNVPLLDLFRQEVESQSGVLTAGLLAVERNQAVAEHLESCMRAAHSLKGAARIIGLQVGVRVASALEECFVAAQHGRIVLVHAHIDRLFSAIDLMKRIAETPESSLGVWNAQQGRDVDVCLSELEDVLAQRPIAPAPMVPAIDAAPVDRLAAADRSDRVLRVSAENLNRLLGLASESLVESRCVKRYSQSLQRLKRLQGESARRLRRLHELLPDRDGERLQSDLATAERGLLECQQLVAEQLIEVDLFDRRSTNLSHRLYDEALACRMRPFADGVQEFPRMVRDLSRSLGKHVRLQIAGEATSVDRDILQRLDAPLGHLLRNAVDHGIETPDERLASGKPAEGVVRLEARHCAGMLHVTVSDDGRGADLEKLRAAVVARHLTTLEASRLLTDSELLDFLFLPGFTMKESVTDISGRGVGLDVVRDAVKQVRGLVRVSSTAGEGTQFLLQLPITLSVVRTLLAEIGGEPYAFPLASISRAMHVPRAALQSIEGRPHFDLDGRSVGLVAAHQVLAVAPPSTATEALTVVVLGAAARPYGLIVDRFLGERELVVQPLDPALGKIKDVAAAALMEDGTPVLILDIDDVIQSINKICAESQLTALGDRSDVRPQKKRKRVLIVDDSLTVRELERKLLGNLGYEVEVAVDGVDGWNAVRTGGFNLVVTDIDMPRMDGIELVTLINKDPNLKSVPVMIVSYKDREEDRRRGLEAGAAYYLTKGSFHDETLAQAVIDLIGEAGA